jgi:hypothetical protein
MSDIDSRIPSELILKLFDTLKEANKDVKITVDKQTDAIVHLSSLLKEGVKPDDIKKLLEDHHKHSGEHLDNIDTCTETINDNSSKILSLLKGMTKRINTMILIVLITFGLMTVAYLFVSNSVETMIKTQIDKSIHSEENIFEDEHSDISEQIEELRKMIRGFHGEE